MKNKKTILLCEDEEFVARSYIRKLEIEGYTVVHARNGQEVIDYLKTLRPNLILLDLMMPLKTGFEVLKDIQEGDDEVKKIPIIVASNLGQKSDIDEALRLGAKDFLIKSNISLKELMAKVSQNLAS